MQVCFQAFSLRRSAMTFSYGPARSVDTLYSSCVITIRHNPLRHTPQHATTVPLSISSPTRDRVCTSHNRHLPISELEARRQRYSITLTFLFLCAPSPFYMQNAPTAISNELSNVLPLADALGLPIPVSSSALTIFAHRATLSLRQRQTTLQGWKSPQ